MLGGLAHRSLRGIPGYIVNHNITKEIIYVSTSPWRIPGCLEIILANAYGFLGLILIESSLILDSSSKSLSNFIMVVALFSAFIFSTIRATKSTLNHWSIIHLVSLYICVNYLAKIFPQLNVISPYQVDVVKVVIPLLLFLVYPSVITQLDHYHHPHHHRRY